MPRSAERDCHVILVTGPSGAGRSTAIAALQDAGFDGIDNMPLTLMPRLLDDPYDHTRLVLGVDTRNRDFSIAQFIETVDALSKNPDISLNILYIDCSSDVLLRRFSETRRRHPQAPTDRPLTGIERELELLWPIRERADVLIDSSTLSPRELRSEVERHFVADLDSLLAISVQSFSYKRGIPRGLDIMFDCRFLRNPHWDETLRAMNGQDAEVQAYVQADPRYAAFVKTVEDMLNLVVPAHTEEGRTHLAIGFGCTGGQHRSVAMAEHMFSVLSNQSLKVALRHREMDRWAMLTPYPQAKTA